MAMVMDLEFLSAFFPWQFMKIFRMRSTIPRDVVVLDCQYVVRYLLKKSASEFVSTGFYNLATKPLGNGSNTESHGNIIHSSSIPSLRSTADGWDGAIRDHQPQARHRLHLQHLVPSQFHGGFKLELPIVWAG